MHENVTRIGAYLKRKITWAKELEKKENPPTLPAMLLKDLEREIDKDDELFVASLEARTDEQKHAAILDIVETRSKANQEDKEPRKLGWVERQLDETAARYLEDPTDADRDLILHYVAVLGVNRRVRFFYDIQQLRISTQNRHGTSNRLHGDVDRFIEQQSLMLERMEGHCEKMVDRTLRRSPYSQFYGWLIDNHLGIGVMMAACIISEVAAPERFRTVSALWKYAGLAVVGHNPETGEGGHAQMRVRGELAQWNHFLRTKLLGVLAPCIVKAQTKYIGTEDAAKAKNVKVMQDYKHRLISINNMIPENGRYYDVNGDEVLAYNSDKPITVARGLHGPIVAVRPSEIKRRTPAHMNRMAQRYMIKMLVSDLLIKWREIQGLPALVPYDVEKLRGGRPHGG